MKRTFLAMLMLTALVDGGGGDAENANEPTAETTETVEETTTENVETSTPEAVAASEEVEETANASEA